MLLTDGVMERYWVQVEMRSAIKLNKNIILVIFLEISWWLIYKLKVHDLVNARFPDVSTVPDDIKIIFNRKAIPYIRDEPLRTTCIQELLTKIK